MQAIPAFTGPRGEGLFAKRVLPGNPDVQFLRNQLQQSSEGWPFDAHLQSWGPLVQDGATFKAGYKHCDPRLPESELYLLYLQETDKPVACATLMGTDMTRAFDPLLPAWVESLTPWRACVAGPSEYAKLVGTIILRRAKEHGFKVVYLFVSVPADEKIPSTWRGFPCELVWRGRYCDQIPLPDGRSRSELPDQMVLAIPLENVPDV